MSGILSREDRLLLALLREALGTVRHRPAIRADIDFDWEELLRLADAHAVSAVLCDIFLEYKGIPEYIVQRIQKSAQVTVLSNYRLLFLTKYLTEYLMEHGILAVTLKGASTASLYPVPEYRKSGDVDLLIAVQADCVRAAELLQQAGFHMEEYQSALHHIEMRSMDGVSVELHSLLAEPFENQRINRYLESLLPEYQTHLVENMSWGVRLYEPCEAYHAFYLLLHMLQHFLREGFGLKNLCDWVLFWNREIDEAQKRRFAKLVEESGTGKFARVLTAVCVRYLGLEKGRVAFLMTEPVREDMALSFLQEVLEAGEFGTAQEDRMVAMPGTGIAAYVQEFQHQMHLNYPRAGRVIFCWPLLWGLTLGRFLYNNRKLHRAPVRRILKKAGRRSVLVEQMELFKQ